MKTEIIANEDNIRIDSYLAKIYDNFSRAYFAKLIHEDKVLYNNKLCKQSEKVSLGAVISIDFPEIEESRTIPENIDIDIIYEDEWLAIINKPQGMVVHPAAGHKSGTLVNALLHRFKGELSDINGVIRPGIVHRIDKDTSGLLLVVKQNTIHKEIAELIRKHEIKRTYLAIVNGIIEENTGTIDASIGRSSVNRLKNSVVKDGKQAISHFRVIDRFYNMSYVEIDLETGRTHQIRVHFAYIHHPVLGDPLYGGQRKGYETNGQLLHAYKLEFIHPVTKETVIFKAPVPDYFEKILKQLDIEKNGK
ncbi:MAG: RluA family pseudouridine synthase [Saccharofermentanales bacterium]